MSQLRLPDFFREKLSGHPLDADVLKSLDRCSEFFSDRDRNLPFFPEYTDHGCAHVQGVLDASADLITSEARSILTPKDIAVLVASVLLHDSAMHLTPDSFLQLIKVAASPCTIPSLDKLSWANQWDEYLTEAKRWDGRKLHRVLGSVSENLERSGSDLVQFVKSPSEMGDPDRWPPVYLKFVGEFIRQHHPRLAHEFALGGVPGLPGTDRIPLTQIGDLDDLAGFVARSHGVELRKCFDYLKTKYYGIFRPKNVYAIYLMVILRIADYIQVDSTRAPASTLRVKALRNPISIAEWSNHLSIEDVMPDDHDPEKIMVVAKPQDVATYLRIRSLLDGLQLELDQSWAVLGEVYSGKSDSKGLKFHLRRVRSNLDDIEKFREEVGYIPGKFAFESAGTDLLKKLVVPLYGHNPEVGIRELLQNAIDAVRELTGLSSAGSASHVQTDPAHAEVSIRLEGNPDSGGSLTVEDRGVGMTEDTIRSYFLSVGASFRDSDTWRKVHTKDGLPTVTRSGRFGVGVLAAFLLGNRVQVTTRHFREEADQGLTFEASIDDQAIEVKRISRQQHGTSIRVEIDGPIFSKLSKDEGEEWDWYRWVSPRVERTINGKPCKSLIRVPFTDSELNYEWNRLTGSGFDEVIWTYGRYPRLVCNGLNVGSAATSRGYSRHLDWEGDSSPHDMSIAIEVPSVSVTDRSARLPLDLQRYSISNHRFPFADNLMAETTRDYCAYCLVFAPITAPWVDKSDRNFWPSYPGRNQFYSQMSFRMEDWFYTELGSGPPHLANLKNYRPQSALLKISVDENSLGPIAPIAKEQGVFHGKLYARLESYSFQYAIGHIFGVKSKNLGPHLMFFSGMESAAALMSSEISEQYEDYQDAHGMSLQGKGINYAKIVEKRRSKSRPGITVWSLGDVDFGMQLLSTDTLADVMLGKCIVALLQNPFVNLKRDSAFVRTWVDTMPCPVIPYNIEERRRLFASAYVDLVRYIDKWEAVKKLGREKFKSLFHWDRQIVQKF